MNNWKLGKLKRILCIGGAVACCAFSGGMGIASADNSSVITIPQTMENGETVEVYYRKGLSPEAVRARGAEFKTESMVLKAGTVRMPGARPLSCDILFEKDVPVTLRDGTVIYTDIFRPVDNEKHPAIMAWSPYGKEIGGQWLDDVPFRSGVPMDAVSGLQKFEGPDPAYWVQHGYVIINPDSRGAYESQGNLNYWGHENSLDGRDTIEWAAAQPWSNGKIGMSGNSWLTVSQWFIAGEQPPHLAAIAPWEGFVDHFRETANRGGIPNPIFPEKIFDTFASRNLIEDQPRMVVTHTLMDGYWQDKIAKLSNINIPAYVVASYTNPVHTHGTFRGFQQIASKDKWLRVHNTNEWMDYYEPKHVEELRKFFDHYLNNEDNDWEKTPRVRISVLHPGHQDVVDRVEKNFPLPQTKYEKLYLNRNGALSDKNDKAEQQISYDVSQPGNNTFTIKFDKDTELTGYMKLHLNVAAEGSDDMELVALVEKLDKDGNRIPDPMTGQLIQSQGFLRVSQRGLDMKQSTDYDPIIASTKEELLNPGEIVAVDIPIWPMGMKYHAGESLLLTIVPYMAPDGSMVPPFGTAKVSISKDGYTYNPADKVEMKELGGYVKDEFEPSEQVLPPASRNKGRHIIYMGGKYKSYLQIPVIPAK